MGLFDFVSFKLSRKFLIDGFFLFLFVLATVAVTSIYVSSERTFYWWDYAGYNTATVNTANLFRDSPTQAWREVIQSLSKEKNLLISLPLVPFILLFGESRLSYILGVSLIYVLPFRLLLGAISAKLIPVYPRRGVLVYCVAEFINSDELDSDSAGIFGYWRLRVCSAGNFSLFAGCQA